MVVNASVEFCTFRFVGGADGERSGSRQGRAIVSLGESGVRLDPDPEAADEPEIVANRSARRRGLCSCISKPDSDDEDMALPMCLPFSDLLGAAALPAGSEPSGSSSVRVVYCPKSGDGGPRKRSDLVLDLGEKGVAAAVSPSSTGAVVDKASRAKAWAAAVSSKCLANARERHLLVFINPTSGSGTAPQDWALTESLWKSVPGIRVTAVTTSRAGEATEYASTKDLSAFDGIVIVSGDGMVHEVWNGLASRADAEQALKLPIGHIPGGSGNGLAKSILHASGESYGVLDAAFLIAKGGIFTKTLMSCRVGDSPPCTSFLSLSAATISDIDISSECLRAIGGARFTVWAVGRVVKPVWLRASLAYWPADAAESLPSQEPALDAELPGSSWQHIEDTFAIFWAGQVAWASYDSHSHPGAAFDSGEWHMMMLRGGSASRLALLNALLGFEDGSHVDVEGLEMVRCRAFRLTPHSEAGIFSLDGEVVPFRPFQAWPAKHSGRVLGATAATAPEPEASTTSEG